MMSAYLLAVSDNTAKLLLAYGVCGGIILVALVAMGFLNRRTKRQMRPISVKKACMKAKKYAEESLAMGDNAQKLLGATRLHRLSALVSNAAWLSYQIVENKRDIVFDGIASGLDGLATSLAKDSEQGYLPDEELETSLKAAIDSLNSTIAKIDKIINA
ncbi:MAG: hypothetical protein E7352_04020 [Clostridiales bacterium]|nr:hypothetical protein [Clostridiales bacterium]